MATYMLKKPITYDGREYKVIEYDFDATTGDDILTAEAEVVADGVLAQVPLATSNFSLAFFARAANVDYHMIKKMSARDVVFVLQAVQSFLNDSV